MFFFEKNSIAFDQKNIFLLNNKNVAPILHILILKKRVRTKSNTNSESDTL